MYASCPIAIKPAIEPPPCLHCAGGYDRCVMILSCPINPLKDKIQAQPIEVHRAPVQAEWIDYNGHMNVAYYVLAFDHATDSFLDLLDVGVSYMQRTNKSTFVLETHVTYAREVQLGDPLRFTAQLLDADEKRLHYYIEMFHEKEGYLSATSEQIALHVDLETRRAAPFDEITMRRIDALQIAHRGLERPDAVGNVIGIRRKSAA